MNSQDPTYAVDFFAGTGGAALGVGRAGWTQSVGVERDPAAAATLCSAGFPAVEAQARDADFAAFRGRAAPLWASPPCQPGSTADQRRCAADECNDWSVTLAAIDACRPTWLLAVNVLGRSYHLDLCADGHAPVPAAGSKASPPSRPAASPLPAGGA